MKVPREVYDGLLELLRDANDAGRGRLDSSSEPWPQEDLAEFREQLDRLVEPE